MTQKLYNTLHPMTGKGIFLPLGEWDYDGRVRQRLDKAHAEAIANELNARIARDGKKFAPSVQRRLQCGVWRGSVHALTTPSSIG